MVLGEGGEGEYKIYAGTIICEDDDHGGDVWVPTAELDECKDEISVDFEPYYNDYLGCSEEEAEEKKTKPVMVQR